MRLAAAVAATVASASLAACGGGGTDATTTQPAAALADCLESFNDRAPDNFARLARLAHKRGNDLIVGIYGGAEFTARTYDEQLGAGDRNRATIPSGSCVVTEVTGALGPLYLFAGGEDGEWHNLSLTDPEVPLAADPERALAATQRSELSGVEPPAAPKLVPSR